MKYKTQKTKYKGKKNPHYKHGKTTYQHYCIDCDKKINWRSKRCESCAQKINNSGSKNGRYVDGRTSIKYYCSISRCNNEICYSNWYYGSGLCRSCSSKKMWKNAKYRNEVSKKALLNSNRSPNNTEKKLNIIINKTLPNEYNFVGQGKVIIDGLCPDFININGQKKIIELYGDYWHKMPNRKLQDARRIKTYKKYGYKTLIVWEHELKDIDKVTNKIENFNKEI